LGIPSLSIDQARSGSADEGDLAAVKQWAEPADGSNHTLVSAIYRFTVPFTILHVRIL
jgi:hypothetical protein